MSGRAVSVPVAFFAFVVLLAPWARAAQSARLIYARGPGAEACPDERVLRREVAKRVGYDPFFPAAPLTLTVEVDAVGGRARARIVVVEQSGFEKGSQTLYGARDRCADLLASVALAASLALDAAPRPVDAPTLEESTPPPPEPGDVAGDRERTRASLGDVRPADAAGETRDVPSVPNATRGGVSRFTPSLWFAPGGRARFGEWPGPAFGIDLLAEVRVGSLSLGVEGSYIAPRAVEVGAGVAARVSRLTGSLLPCARFGFLVTCGVVTFGETRAEGVDLQVARSDASGYAAFGGRIGLDIPLFPKWHLLGTFDLVGVAARTRLAVDGAVQTEGRPVEASMGIALLVPIW